ncbi:MAG: hypothetical protein AAF517_05885, partial [Planctomycetota bacterium]
MEPRLRARYALSCVLLLPVCPHIATATPFVRGDSNASGRLDITDAIHVLSHLFLGSPPTLDCSDAADVDDSGQVNITDPIATLSYLFLGGNPPPSPFPDCGDDPTDDA